jgi:biotin carboxyl carrier protein
MKKYKLKINGNSYHVHIKDVEGNNVSLEVNGSLYEVEMESEVKKVKTPKLVRSQMKETQKPTADSLKTSESTRKVAAPLPGVILKVQVKDGDAVKVGDILMVMEAMKMENNILAESSGTITSIKVKEGESVLQGDILMEIE